MCGIVYAQSFNGSPVNNAVLQQFDLQRNRGTQGFGLFDGMKLNLVRAANENKILKWLVNYDSDLIMFHHRFPTSTINVKRAAHPFSTKKYFGDTQYILVHNGSISNAKELYAEHTKLGIKYQSLLKDGTFNDSEALLWDFALTQEGKQDKLKVWGGIAFVCMKLTNGELDKLYFARNYSKPLNMTYNHDILELSSEGDGEAIKEHTLYTFNYKLKRMTTKHFQIQSWNSTQTYSKTWDRDYRSWANSCSQNRSRWEEELEDGYYDSLGNWVPSLKYELYDYDQDGNPIYDAYDDETEREEQRQLLLNDQGIHTPSQAQVDMVVLEYLLRSRGSFDTAYYLAENDYADLLDDEIDGMGYTDEIALLEKVLEAIENDPENVDEESISSVWKELESA